MKCFICKEDLVKVENNCWECPDCHSVYPMESFIRAENGEWEVNADEY